MHTAHPIDTLVASSYSLTGRPWLVCAGAFVQQSAARGRPWLRFSAHAYNIERGRVDWYVSAYPTRRAAIAGSMGGAPDRGQAFEFGGANVWG